MHTRKTTTGCRQSLTQRHAALEHGAEGFLLMALTALLCMPASAVEAPAGFDGRTNGLVRQGDYDSDRLLFEKRETPDSGLGPVYNGQSCAECHANPVSGGSSQVASIRAGIFDGKAFKEPAGGSLIHDRAINAAIQARVPVKANVTALRLSGSALGGGFVEAVEDRTFQDIAAAQPGLSNGLIHGMAVLVDVFEAPGTQRVGRFGWKSQHGSLLSFTAEAFRNEMGITNSLFPTEHPSNGRPVDAYDPRVDPENNGWQVALMTEFVRATKVPPRDEGLAPTPAARAGARLFETIGCGICHVPTLRTAPVGTPINGGTFTIPAALANKTFHPYADFLLHDIGTGDGIVQNGGPASRNAMRTAPLWGLRTRSRLLHDGSALTMTDAIKRHGGEAEDVAQAFGTLAAAEKSQLLKFLASL